MRNTNHTRAIRNKEGKGWTAGETIETAIINAHDAKRGCLKATLEDEIAIDISFPVMIPFFRIKSESEPVRC